MSEKSPRKRYPAAYEKLIPIALAAIALAILILLVVIFLVTTGSLPGSS